MIGEAEAQPIGAAIAAVHGHDHQEVDVFKKRLHLGDGRAKIDGQAGIIPSSRIRHSSSEG